MSSLKEKKRIVNKIMALVLSGFHYHDACEIEQVSFGDFCYWIANTKALRAIKESYELQKQQLLEQSLFRAGLGYEYTETHQTKRVRRNAGGDILGDELIQKEIKKLALPNTQAALLLLTKQDPDKWIQKIGETDIDLQLESIRQELLAYTPENDLMEEPPMLPEANATESPMIDVPNQNEKKNSEVQKVR